MNITSDIETYTLQIPQSDVRFFSALTKKMGWTKKKMQVLKPVKKNGLDAALEDIAKGDLKSFDSVDSLMDYLHS